MDEKIKSDIQKLSQKKFEITAKAEANGRELSQEEQTWVAECDGAIEALRKQLPGSPVTLQFGGVSAAQRKPGNWTPVEPGHSKSYQNLFGNRGESWASMGGTPDTDFFSAVASGRHHPGLKMISNSATVTSPESGGFIVPSETASQIHDIGLEGDFVMGKAWVVPMRHGEIKIPATQIGDHSSNLMGGFQAYWVEEEGTLNEANPKVREITLKARKLTGLIKYSAELFADSQGGQDAIISLCGKGLGWYRLKAWLQGTGIGEPLGVQNSPCLVSVAKQTGQVADSIVFENILDMMAAFYMPGWNRAVWVANPSCIPQLMSMSLAVGLGGAPIQPAMIPDAQGNFTLMTRPMIFTEHAPVLGDANDLMLCDFGQYVIGLTEELRYDQSIHPAFLTDQIYSRLITRCCATTLWDEPLVLATGQEVSPFVGLAERA